MFFALHMASTVMCTALDILILNSKAKKLHLLSLFHMCAYTS